MKYAIIIVTYNRKHLLEECVINAFNQTLPADKIVIVNNASTDGTTKYFKADMFQGEPFAIINCDKNMGGAGGFYKGMEKALDYDIDWMIIIDDDAILDVDYAEKVFKELEKQTEYQAAAGIVKVNGEPDKYHRRNLSRYGMFLRTLDNAIYRQKIFTCDVASFCGMLVKKELVQKIGLPHADYFIFHDDTEYSLRISRHTKFLIVTDAVLNHKTDFKVEEYPRRYTWKDYYEIRNRLLYVKEHGNIFDIFINEADIFVNKILRNWIFGIIKKDGYNWKYERKLVREAIRNARSGSLRNVIIEREG